MCDRRDRSLITALRLPEKFWSHKSYYVGHVFDRLGHNVESCCCNVFISSNIPNSKINLMGYGLATLRGSSKLLVDCLGKQDFQVVILDESHYLKNRNAGRTKVLQSVARKAKRKILLSGTPSLARPEEVGPESITLVFGNQLTNNSITSYSVYH